jgi:hypothetical protein
MTALANWQNFYVIVGSSAGALIGLQFVVIALVSGMAIARDQGQASAAFATPTIVHFCVALLLAAIACAPWQKIGAAAVLWGLLGLVGVVYEVIVFHRMRVQMTYAPEFEDWLFHVLLPLLAYATLAGSACATLWNMGWALFAVGAASLLLLLVGIHNAWDAVTYHVFSVKRERKTE